MTAHQLGVTAGRLERALAARTWERAREEAEAYGAALREALRDGGLAAGDLEKSIALLERARRTVLAGRSHCAQRLARLRSMKAYAFEASAAAHIWGLEG